MFVKLALLALLITSSLAKQPCPVCRDVIDLRTGSNSSYPYKPCSEAIEYKFNWPCPEGETCKIFKAELEGYANIRSIKCVDPSASCSSEFPSYDSCTESYVFRPDKCPSCSIYEAYMEGERVVESSCSSDTSQWTTCDRGTSCNRLWLPGFIDHDLSEFPGRLNINIMGCGLPRSDCDDLEREFRNRMSETGIRITTCIHKEF